MNFLDKVFLNADFKENETKQTLTDVNQFEAEVEVFY